MQLSVLPSLACSSCFFGEDGVRWAYYISAIVMFLMPLMMVGGTFRFLRVFGRARPGGAKPTSTRLRPVLMATFACIALVLLVLGLERPLAKDKPGASPAGEPPVLTSILPFSLVDQSKKPFGTEQLAGRVWIANFVFTRCPTICPRLTGKMVELQAATRDLLGTHLVTFSMDPEYDTPAVLASYGRKYGADPRRWTFVTGPIEQVKHAVEVGLNVAMGNAGGEVDVSEVLHGTKFVLVDKQSRIRGYYDVETKAGRDRLIRDAERLQ